TRDKILLISFTLLTFCFFGIFIRERVSRRTCKRRIFTMDEEGRVSGLQGFRDFLNNITHGTFWEDSSMGSDDDRRDAEFYSVFSSSVDSLDDGEGGYSSGGDDDREINLHPEESSPDCWADDEASTSQHVSGEENEEELPHGENRMETHLRGSPPHCSADDASTSQQAGVEEHVGELPHEGNKGKRKLPHESDDEDVDILPILDKKRKLAQANENFTEGSPAGYWDINDSRSKQTRGEDNEGEKKVPPDEDNDNIQPKLD
ncbi:hypothetical protein C7M84_007816, partial [Penaeus vannamei]